MKHHSKQSFPFMSHRFSVSHIGALSTLATSRLLAFLGSSVIGLFFSIFLFEFFDLNITSVLLWFTLVYLIRFPTHVLAAKIFSKIGLVPSMVVGTFGAVVFYVSLYFLDLQSNISSNLLLGIAVAGLTVLSTFYWTPFHIDFAEFGTKGKRGRQIALFSSFQQVIGIISPILGGFLIAEYGYGVLFVFAIFVLIVSLVPMIYLPRTYVQYEFGFFETYKKMFSKEFLPLTISMFSYGAENIVGVIIWPLFLYTVFSGDYLSIGVFAGVLVVINILLQLFVGSLVDRKSSNKILSFGTHIYALGWVGKALVSSIFGVFAASTFHTFGSIMMRTPMNAIYYEKAADSGHYVDEFTVIKETAMTLGRGSMSFLLIGVTAWMSLQGAFVIAGIISLGISILTHLHSKTI